MNTILDTILATKRKEVALLKEQLSFKDFEQSTAFYKKCTSLSKSITSKDFGIIAELKRKSPSAGIIHSDYKPGELARTYEEMNAAGISCLTDFSYFGGSNEDLQIVKLYSDLPVLRKDFIIDEIQVLESKAIGADAILLIAEALTKKEALQLTVLAQSLGMEVVLEFHSLAEFSKLNHLVDIVGVNNRDLKRQLTSLQTSMDLIGVLPDDKIRISESGIKTRDEIELLQQLGYHGALIGESILRSEKAQLLNELTFAS